MAATSLKTNRMLWGRAASRCAFPDCRRELVIESFDADDPSLVGEAAHIIAEKLTGPRGQSELTVGQRNRYANLILLCNIHHKQVDDQVNDFTVERLIAMKEAHELWVRTALSGFDAVRQADDERWAGYIDEWESRAELDSWLVRIYPLLQAEPSIERDFFDRLSEIRGWILSRVWPSSHSEIRDALENFRHVVGDLVNVFERHSTPTKEGSFLRTEAFYRIKEWDPERYEFLVRRYEFHVDMIHDLTYEMTRAANYVCDKVRETLHRSYRVEQGVLLVRGGVTMDLMEYTYRLEYRDEERSRKPYPGLEKFMNLRGSRDNHVGEGQEPT